MPSLTLTPSHSGLTRRLLRSPIVDLLLGPHGVDRYLELISPALTVGDARAEVLAVRRQTPRSATLTLRPNGAWEGFSAGQFTRVGVEIDGIRRTRTYSPAGSAHAGARELELTVTAHPGGLVSERLPSVAAPGAILHLGSAQGEFVLPDPRPERIVLISGGSGITPVMSMLRTLRDEDHAGEVAFVHYARTRADWLYEPEVRALARGRRGLDVRYLTTREGARERLDADTVGDVDDSCWAAACGPPALVEAARDAWARRGGRPSQLLAETFTPLARASADSGGGVASGTLRLARSDRSVPLAAGTLLEQAEAAGLSPEFGCRMGICHTCTCRKAAGSVRNVLTGEVSDEEDEDIQLCISVPAGDVALEL
jgi:stearoyl-CoA 9-desaturase NADPH oxidoreductase